jgi:hypothetical protein
MPVGDLARRLAMERTTCTREVAPLVRSGLVEAAAGPAEFGGAEVQELLIRLRRLTGGSERLAAIQTKVDH